MVRNSMRKLRESIKNDPVRHEEAKKKDRERYYARKAAGKIKGVADMTEREKRAIRKKWKDRSKKKTTPPPSPQQQPIQAIQEQDVSVEIENQVHALCTNKQSSSRSRVLCGEKIRRNNRRKQNIKIKELEKKLQDAEKNVRKYKKRVQRLKKIKNKKQSPRTYIENLVCGLNVGQEVKKKLLFGEVISTQLKENYKGKRGSIQKRMFIENINGPLIKKYRFTKYISSLSSNNIIYGNRKKRQVMHQKVLQVRRCVKSFLLKDENSRLCPGKRDTVTFRKRKMQKRYLNDSLKNIYEKTLDDLVNSYTCVSDYLMEKCLEKQCLKCQQKEINILDHDGDEKTFYEKWVTRKQVLEIKGEEKICQRTVKEKILCKKSDIVHTLKQGFHGFLLHLRNIVHQYRIIDDIKKNISTEEILIHADFSENYSCKYNEEVQSAHFGSSKPQITLHTVVIYYKNPGTAKIEPLSIGTLSDSLRHDPPSICAHLQLAIKEIQKIVATIRTVHFLSDGPSTQYKNKKMFFLMAHFLTRELGVTSLHWHYSESGHGKGAPDGVGAVVKRTADRLVAMGRDIPDLQNYREITYDRLRYTDVYSSSDESDDTDDIPLASLRDKMSVYFREGMYVVIKLTGKKIVRHYVGVILRNDGGGEYNIKFMKKTGRKTFVYPERDDIADVDLSDIQIGLGCPDFNDKTNEYVFSDNLDYPNLY
nr:unnamed protein product [Callosobruchus analis]